MKRIFLFLILSMLVLTGVNAAAPNSPYSVAGVISIEGTPLDSAAVKIENTNKLTSDLVYTNQYGEYAKDLTLMSGGVSNNDNIKVTACIADTRCNEKSETFTASSVSSSGFVRIDITVNPKEPSGISVPYNIIGKVKIDGNYIENEDVELFNQRTENSKTVRTDSAGFYSFNLANFNDLYQTGDKIDIKVRWYTKTITVLGGVPFLTADIDIASSEPSTSPAPGGDGGSSVSPGPGKAQPKDDAKETPKIDVDNDLSFPEITTATVSLGIGESKTFSIDGLTSHSLTVNKIGINEDGKNYAEITVKSDPITLMLIEGISQIVELDEGKIKFTLTEIINNKAEITMERVQDKAQSEPLLDNKEKEREGEAEITGKDSKGIWIVLIIIAVIITGVIYFLKRRSS